MMSDKARSTALSPRHGLFAACTRFSPLALGEEDMQDRVEEVLGLPISRFDNNMFDPPLSSTIDEDEHNELLSELRQNADPNSGALMAMRGNYWSPGLPVEQVDVEFKKNYSMLQPSPLKAAFSSSNPKRKSPLNEYVDVRHDGVQRWSVMDASGINDAEGHVQIDEVRSPGNRTSSKANTPSSKLRASEQLEAEIPLLVETLQAKASAWEERIEALKRIQRIAKFPVASPLLAELFMPLLPGLSQQIGDLRSQVVKQACVTIGELAAHLGFYFAPYAQCLLPPLCSLTRVAKKVMSEAADACIRQIILDCQALPALEGLIEMAQTNKSPIVRCRCTEYVTLAFESWQVAHLEPFRDHIAACIAQGCSDSTKDVRHSARMLYLKFFKAWDSAGRELFFLLPSNVKRVIDEEFPTLFDVPAEATLLSVDADSGVTGFSTSFAVTHREPMCIENRSATHFCSGSHNNDLRSDPVRSDHDVSSTSSIMISPIPADMLSDNDESSDTSSICLPPIPAEIARSVNDSFDRETEGATVASSDIRAASPQTSDIKDSTVVIQPSTVVKHGSKQFTSRRLSPSNSMDLDAFGPLNNQPPRPTASESLFSAHLSNYGADVEEEDREDGRILDAESSTDAQRKYRNLKRELQRLSRSIRGLESPSSYEDGTAIGRFVVPGEDVDQQSESSEFGGITSAGRTTFDSIDPELLKSDDQTEILSANASALAYISSITTQDENVMNESSSVSKRQWRIISRHLLTKVLPIPLVLLLIAFTVPFDSLLLNPPCHVLDENLSCIESTNSLSADEDKIAFRDDSPMMEFGASDLSQMQTGDFDATQPIYDEQTFNPDMKPFAEDEAPDFAGAPIAASEVPVVEKESATEQIDIVADIGVSIEPQSIGDENVASLEFSTLQIADWSIPVALYIFIAFIPIAALLLGRLAHFSRHSPARSKSLSSGSALPAQGMTVAPQWDVEFDPIGPDHSPGDGMGSYHTWQIHKTDGTKHTIFSPLRRSLRVRSTRRH